MKYSIIDSISVKKSEVNYLKSVKLEVSSVRKEFYNFSKKCNLSIGEALVNHFNDRIQKSGEILMLGEYVPFVFGNLFNISNNNIKKIAFPWFLMYEYSLLIDDLLDEDREKWKTELIASQYLLDKSYSKFFKELGKTSFSLDKYELYREQSFEGMLSEIDVKSNIGSVLLQGRKSALVKFCVSSMIELENNRLISIEEENLIDDICSAIQLIDDLTDFKEDYERERVNLLLTTSFDWLKKNYNIYDKINYEQLVFAMIFSNSISTSLEFSEHLLNKINNNINTNSINQYSIHYFKSISEECSKSLHKIDNLIKMYSSMEEEFYRMLFVDKQLNIKIKNIWNRILEEIQLLPKASN